MHDGQQDFAETYRSLPNEEIAALCADTDSLTDAARSALSAEMQRRGVNDAQLQKMHRAELRHEALFDRLQKQRRKNLAWYLLTRRYPKSPKGWIFAILGALVLILISELISHHH